MRVRGRVLGSGRGVRGVAVSDGLSVVDTAADGSFEIVTTADREFAGPDLPPRRKWVEPYPSGHLFRVPASREARKVTIEATDRFGRVYTDEIAT